MQDTNHSSSGQPNIGGNETTFTLKKAFSALSNKPRQSTSAREDTVVSLVNSTTSNTIIVAFSDFSYRGLALKWYRRLEQLGYTQHLLVPMDPKAASFFARHKLRFDFLDANHSFSFTSCDQHLEPAKRSQKHRRHIFGSRWNYILRHLKSGSDVMVSDVDTIFNQYRDLRELEESNVDAYHAFATGVPSFPKNIFRKFGFTLNGGMHWLRSVEGVVQFIQKLVVICKCETLDCTCMCDDQVVFNRFVFGLHRKGGHFKYVWDQALTIPKTWEDVSFSTGLSGNCSATGHRVKVWDRNTAYRGPINATRCPLDNWFSMPNLEEKLKMLPKAWDDACGWTLPGITPREE